MGVKPFRVLGLSKEAMPKGDRQREDVRSSMNLYRAFSNSAKRAFAWLAQGESGYCSTACRLV
jgi:hypothetical protein